jgi:hypothetical protein
MDAGLELPSDAAADPRAIDDPVFRSPSLQRDTYVSAPHGLLIDCWQKCFGSFAMEHIDERVGGMLMKAGHLWAKETLWILAAEPRPDLPPAPCFGLYYPLRRSSSLRVGGFVRLTARCRFYSPWSRPLLPLSHDRRLAFRKRDAEAKA